jgi:enamine deaminase RidA (YjgF/YER057c/UK114 family)
MTKTPIGSARTGFVSAALNLSNISDLLLFTASADSTSSDPLEQLRAIYAHLESLLGQAGYSMHDVVRFETTVTEAVSQEQIEQLLVAIRERWQDMEIKPVAGTFRVVKALARPGMLVEVDMLAAR